MSWLTSGRDRLREKQKNNNNIPSQRSHERQKSSSKEVPKHRRRTVQVVTKRPAKSMPPERLNIPSNMNTLRDLQLDVTNLRENLLIKHQAQQQQQQSLQEELLRHQIGLLASASPDADILPTIARPYQNAGLGLTAHELPQGPSEMDRQRNLESLKEELKFHEQLLIHDELLKTKKKEERALLDQELQLRKLSNEHMLSQFNNGIEQLSARQEMQQRQTELENSKVCPDPSILAAALGVFGQQQVSSPKNDLSRQRLPHLSSDVFGVNFPDDPRLNIIQDALTDNTSIEANLLARTILASGSKGMGVAHTNENILAQQRLVANSRNELLQLSMAQQIQERGSMPHSSGHVTRGLQGGLQGFLKSDEKDQDHQGILKGGNSLQSKRPIPSSVPSSSDSSIKRLKVSQHSPYEGAIASSSKNLSAPPKGLMTFPSKASKATSNKEIRYFNNGAEVDLSGVPITNQGPPKTIDENLPTATAEKVTKGQRKSKKFLIQRKFEGTPNNDLETTRDTREKSNSALSSTLNQKKKEQNDSKSKTEETVNDVSGNKEASASKHCNHDTSKTSIMSASSSALTAASALLGFMKPK